MPENPPKSQLVEEWSKVLLPIIAFIVGLTLVVYDGIIDPPSDSITSGFGLVAAGLAPFGLLDAFKKKDG